MFRRFCNMFSESSSCLLGQHGSCSTAQQLGELSKTVYKTFETSGRPTPYVKNPNPTNLFDALVALLVIEDVGEALEDGGGGGAAEGGEQRRVRGRRLGHGAQHAHGREGVRRQPPRVPASMAINM